MRYVVHTRQSIASIAPREAHAIISIANPKDSRSVLPSNPTCQGVLQCTFHDVIHADYDPSLITPFDRNMANTILDFWISHSTVDTLYIHCDGGQCRSPAVAAALQYLETGEDDHWFAMKNPNRLVYRLILDEGHRRNLNRVQL